MARFAVTGLEPGAQYQAGLFSYNTKGRSEPVILQAATLRLPEKQLTQEKGEKCLTNGQVPVKSFSTILNAQLRTQNNLYLLLLKRVSIYFLTNIIRC